MMHATVSATAPSALAHRLWPVAQAARLTRFTRLAAGIGTAALLAACSILPAPTPVDTYVLPGAAWQRAATTEHTRTHPAAAGAALRIARPVTDGLLSSRRIAVMPQADRLQVYQGALWSNPPATLLRSRLLDAFLADGRLPWVDTDESPATRVDYLLTSQLRAFHSVYENGSPTAVVRIDAQIVDTASNRAVASRSFLVRQPAASKEIPDVVQALGQASDQLSKDMVDWAVQSVRSANTSQ